MCLNLLLQVVRMLAESTGSVGRCSISHSCVCVCLQQDMPAGLGALRLALLAAQTPEGAAWLHTCGVMPALVYLTQQLLSNTTSGLSDFGSVSMVLQPVMSAAAAQQHQQATAIVSRPLPPSFTQPQSLLSALPVQDMDTAGAYIPAAASLTSSSQQARAGAGLQDGQQQPQLMVVSPLHARWCTLLSFSGALIRSLGQHVDVSGNCEFATSDWMLCECHVHDLITTVSMLAAKWDQGPELPFSHDERCLLRPMSFKESTFL